jgi:hypothetical protein
MVQTSAPPPTTYDISVTIGSRRPTYGMPQTGVSTARTAASVTLHSLGSTRAKKRTRVHVVHVYIASVQSRVLVAQVTLQVGPELLSQ